MRSVVLLIFLSIFSILHGIEKIKIACVGNSITYGAGVANREKNSYPAQLQVYLGDEYEVKNFGISGRTLLEQGDYPYINCGAYKQSLDFNPDVVLIKLGTNDSKPQNIRYVDQFKDDYIRLIRSYQQLLSKPRIILLTPVRCYLPPNSEIKNEVIQRQIRPLIEEIAYEEGLEIINLYSIFGNQWDASVMPDRLHPSSIGAGVIAKHLYEYLSTPRSASLSPQLNGSKTFNYYGYKGYEFQLNGVTCYLVPPKQAAKQHPWMMRARFWGHEPQTDIAMLEHGFYLTYCDVADLYGSPIAVNRWNRFYKEMQKIGLQKKMVIEAMSRGGLIAYNWAVENPKKVACIYADAPVMDIKSWPLGHLSKTNRSVGDAANVLKTYNFSSEDSADKWNKNPVDAAKKLAKANVPLLHVVGDADVVVPVSENTDIFETRYQAAGGKNLQVIHKPGIGHHPHSLNNPEPIVRFILNATGRAQNYCTKPICGNEFRSGAGWQEGAEWHAISDEITQTLKDRNLKLLLLGNSITQGFGGNRTLVSYKPGKAAMDKTLGKDEWEAAGISGDRTQNLLWRLQNGNYTCCNPQNIVITIGINNLCSGNDSPEETALGIKAVALESQKQFPDAHILLLGLLPSALNPDHPVRKKCDRIHELLAKEKWKNIHYVNPTSLFVNPNGELKKELYSGDYLHLNAKGYEIWSAAIKNWLSL